MRTAVKLKGPLSGQKNARPRPPSSFIHFLEHRHTTHPQPTTHEMKASSASDVATTEFRAASGAPFPPRPKAIATFLASEDFVPGCQALLHSVKVSVSLSFSGRHKQEILSNA